MSHPSRRPSTSGREPAVKGTTVNVAKAGKLIGGIAGAGLRAGASKTVALSLPPGHYVLLCNLPAHYKSGQYAAFTVK